MAQTQIIRPQFTDSIDLRYFIEGYTGPSHPINLLERFPDSLYTKSPDSHFIRFMYALLGPTGVGWLRLAILLSRLTTEAAGTQTSELEAAYGEPFSLARNIQESYNDDLSGLLPASVWARIEAQDELYRTRAIEYLNAARLGTTPDGMALAASSGIGQNCEVAENYQFLFDQHSDVLLGLPYYGETLTLNEFIVIPRLAVSRTVQQLIEFSLSPVALGSNTFTLSYNGYTTAPLAPTVTANAVQSALQGLQSLGPNVLVSGGPPPNTFTVTFTGVLSGGQVFPIIAQFNSGSQIVNIPVAVTTGGLDPSTEAAYIRDQDRHAMQTAIDYLKPVNSVPTFYPDFSTLRSQLWGTIDASSELPQVIRFVTGSSLVNWPSVDSSHWIETSLEIEAPQSQGLRGNYVGFHNVLNITAYTDLALSDPNYATSTSILSQYNSVHVGSFPEMAPVMPYFNQFTNSTYVFTPDQALADYAEALTVTTQGTDGAAYINGIYPADYITLQGVPDIKYHNDHFWSSKPRASGAEILEIDLGFPQAVNYLSFEITKKPITIEIDYDSIDQAPARNFISVDVLEGPDNDSAIFFQAAEAPWQYLEFYFNDGLAMIFTRFIRIILTRQAPVNGFLFDRTTQTQTPWSIEVRNLRLGRNVPPNPN